jgi:aspartyl-tRNA(Asn)/glutamyl-tRNA(Gln) amidotransferase subunit B
MPVILSDSLVAEWAATLPELPSQRRMRFAQQYGIPEYDARVLSAEKNVGDYFEKAATLSRFPKAVSNWVMTDILRTLSEQGIPIDQFSITPEALVELIELTETRVINSNTAKDVFGFMLTEGGRAGDIVKSRGLAQVSDSDAIQKIIDETIAGNCKSVQDYRNGKEAALKFLVGQVMKISKGKANPQMATEMLIKRLSA